jgi:hypothetical protein
MTLKHAVNHGYTIFGDVERKTSCAGIICSSLPTDFNNTMCSTCLLSTGQATSVVNTLIEVENLLDETERST